MPKISFKLLTALVALSLVAGVVYKIVNPKTRRVTFVDANVENLYKIIHSYDDNELIEVEGFSNRFRAKKLKRTPIHTLLENGHFIDLPKFFKQLSSLPMARVNPKQTKADIIVFSYDRPLQLYAFLESSEKYVKGLHHTYVIYRTSNEDFELGYAEVKHDFPGVTFLCQEKLEDFKPLVKRAMQADFVAFAVDDILIKDEINFQDAALEIQKTGAYGFYYRLGHNITFDYMNNKSVSVPKTINLGKGVYAWQFITGEGDWGYPNTVDFTLFKRSDIEKDLLKLKFENPSTLEEKWSKKVELNRVGLCSKYSKIVNIPLNVVSQKSIDFGNREMGEYTPKELLDIFNQGYKIDVKKFFRVKNKSPHAALEVHFIERNGA